MCWPHVYRNVTPRLSQLRKINRNVADDLLTDIEFLQWSANTEVTFRHIYGLLEEKFLKGDIMGKKLICYLTSSLTSASSG